MREQMTLNLPYPEHLHEEVAALRRELVIRYVEIVRLRTRARLAREALARQDMQALADLLQGA